MPKNAKPKSGFSLGWPSWLPNGKFRQSVMAAFVTAAVLAGAQGTYSFFFGQPAVSVTNKGNGDINISIPRAPGEITAEMIACRGDVELVREGGRVFYRAVWGVMGDDNIPTNYSLIWTINPDTGQPLSQYSVAWTHEDGITDDSDAPPEGVRIPADERSATCLLRAS